MTQWQKQTAWGIFNFMCNIISIRLQVSRRIPEIIEIIVPATAVVVVVAAVGRNKKYKGHHKTSCILYLNKYKYCKIYNKPYPNLN